MSSVFDHFVILVLKGLSQNFTLGFEGSLINNLSIVANFASTYFEGI